MTPVLLKQKGKKRNPRTARTGPHAGRRLSPWRVLLAVAVVGVVTAAVVFAPRALEWYQGAVAQQTQRHWFAGYFDATAEYRTEIAPATGDDTNNVLMSFIVAAAPQTCAPSWGAFYTFDEAAAYVDLDRRIARMRDEGASIGISFGGAHNTELANACADVDALAAAYGSVIDRYGVQVIDLDVEKQNLEDQDAAKRRAGAIAQLQGAREGLSVWLTLPVTPTGLTPSGVESLREMWRSGVHLAGVNVMTMDFGVDLAGRSMAQASIDALTATHDQIAAEAQSAGVQVDAWAMLGVTPMIGQNDVADEVFTLDDAVALNAFARERGMTRMSMWSFNRDRTCGPNHPASVLVSDSCSGVRQGGQTFASLLSAGFEDRPVPMSTARPTLAPVTSDDPATSPYPVWSPEAEYSTGVRVVWHGYVYLANRWSQGVPEPDDPTLGAGESAWTLIGPVLPGDPPYRLPTVPPGTYPEWSSGTVYVAGDRVVWNGTPFEAKWWTQSASPADALTAPSRSPWRMLAGG